MREQHTRLSQLLSQPPAETSALLQAWVAIDDAMIKGLERWNLVGARVKVSDGSAKDSLGLGTVIDLVTVYIGGDPRSGCITSAQDAERPREGARAIPNNPKILLDSGKVVYGCQVWFQLLDAEAGGACQES